MFTLSVYNMQLINIGRTKSIVCSTNLTVGLFPSFTFNQRYDLQGKIRIINPWGSIDPPAPLNDAPGADQRQAVANSDVSPTEFRTAGPPVGCYHLHPPSPSVSIRHLVYCANCDIVVVILDPRLIRQ